LTSCDSLVVVAGKNGRTIPQLAIMAGFALARGLNVVWIGDAVEMIAELAVIQHFQNAEQFCRSIVPEVHAQPNLRIAA
jgi:surface antigen